MIFLRRSSNSPRYLVPATSDADVERQDALVGERLRHVTRDDALGQALRDGGLAHARLPDQRRVVLGPARQDLDDPLDLLLAADDGIDLARAHGIREVDAQLVDGGRLARPLGLLGRAGGARLRQHPDDLVADLVQVHAQRLEHARRDALALAHEAQQQVLRADVVVAQAARLIDGQLDHALGARRQPHLAHDRPIATADDELDRGPDLGQLDVHVLEHARRHALALAHEAEEQVLRADVVVVEPLRLVLSERQDLARAIRELIEPIHRIERPFSSDRAGGSPWPNANTRSAPRRRAVEAVSGRGRTGIAKARRSSDRRAFVMGSCGMTLAGQAFASSAASVGRLGDLVGHDLFGDDLLGDGLVLRPARRSPRRATSSASASAAATSTISSATAASATASDGVELLRADAYSASDIVAAASARSSSAASSASMSCSTSAASPASARSSAAATAAMSSATTASATSSASTSCSTSAATAASELAARGLGLLGAGRLLLGDLLPDLRERGRQRVVDAALGLLDRLRHVVAALRPGPSLATGLGGGGARRRLLRLLEAEAQAMALGVERDHLELDASGPRGPRHPDGRRADGTAR